MAKPGDNRRPFQQGEVVEGRVETLSRRGGAEAVAQGVTVRVAGGVPGDVASLRITHTGKHVVHGRIEALITPSPERVEAPCSVVTQCGGCPWQSASESLQRRTKEAAVDALLGEFYDPQTQRHGWVGPSATVGYRTRAMMVTRHRAGPFGWVFMPLGRSSSCPPSPASCSTPGSTRS